MLWLPDAISPKETQRIFEVYNIHSALLDAIQLIYKSEFESAAREAFVALENYFKKKSGLDSHGFDLATRALSFEIDKQTGEIKRAPLIAINDLKTNPSAMKVNITVPADEILEK